jgi:hypothetical protein
MKKLPLIATSVLLISLTAYAGKEEREYMKNTLSPALKTAETSYKAACGCPLAIKVNESTITSTDDMYAAKHIADSVSEEAAGYCTDAASKKAVCQMKTLELTKAGEAKFTFKGGAGVATTDGQSFVSFEMMTRELDK